MKEPPAVRRLRKLAARLDAVPVIGGPCACSTCASVSEVPAGLVAHLGAMSTSAKQEIVMELLFNMYGKQFMGRVVAFIQSELEVMRRGEEQRG